MKSLNGEVKILPAQPSDYDDLLILCKKSGAHFNYAEQSLREWLTPLRKKDNRITEIFFLNKKRVGFGSHIIFKDYVFGEMLRIDKTFQKMGLGSLFIKRGMEIADKYHLNKLRTAVFASNYKAMNFFTKLGFSEIGKWEAKIFKLGSLLLKNRRNHDAHIYIAQSDDLPTILKFIEDNPTLFLNKMYAENFSWRSLDKDNIVSEIQNKNLMIEKEEDKITSIYLRKIQPEYMEINYFNNYSLNPLQFLLKDYSLETFSLRIYTPLDPSGLFDYFTAVQKLSFKILEKSF